MSELRSFHTKRLFAGASRKWLAASTMTIAIATLCNGAAHADAAPAQTAPEETPNGANVSQNDIVVTAQRRSESASKVPISIVSYSRDLMDRQGIRRIDDIARLTPALRFTQTSGVTGNNGANISIRGLASDVGSATTAIYIDDTPIQIRNVGYFGGNPYPRVFDLERVEVLRGPQGTLFGAGAEGGAVRFITAQPNFDKFSMYARAEGSYTDHGSDNYEGGVAVGGPVTSRLAVRASGWVRRDGGYIDQVAPQTNNVIAKNVNSETTYSAKVALAWRPIDELTISPSLFYQNIDGNARSNYWEGYGSTRSADYKTGVYDLEPSQDHFTLPALKVQYDVGTISIISNTSYFDRVQDERLNYATYFSFLRSGSPFGTYSNENLSNTDDYLKTHQKNFTQEVRVQSYGNKLIDWTAGVYYSRTRQNFSNYTESGRNSGVLVNNHPQYDGRYSFVELLNANDRQIAGYANIDIKPINRVKVSLAARFTHNKFDFADTQDGPTNGGVRTTIVGTQKENSWTPKFGVTYQATDTTMLYASATKGFRPGGAQGRVNAEFCAADLGTLGLTASPTAYKSDSLWSYEAGTKNKLFGGKVNLDLDGYVIKWKNIQQSVRLPTCSFSFIDNLGGATGKGVEASVAFIPMKGVSIGGNVAFTRLTYDSNVYGGNGLLLRAEGQRIGGPLWSGAVYGQVEQPIGARMTGYARVDYSFASKGIVMATQGTFGYDSGLPALNGTNYVSLRAGVRYGGVDLSLFADNLTNSSDLLSRNHDGVGGSLYYDQSYRPRTIGMTAQFHY